MAYELPFIASECFEGIIYSELLYQGTTELAEKVGRFFVDTELQQKILRYVKDLKEQRSWINVATQTQNLFEKITFA